MSTKMIRSLMAFYATPDAPTQDEQLAAASRALAERTATQDRIDLREHDRRYHDGHYESGEPCPFRDKIAKMEEKMGVLDPKDADGDGNEDFPEKEVKEEANEEVSEVSEDSADAVASYFASVAKDEFREEDHPRNERGAGGGRFRTSGATIEGQDLIDGSTSNKKSYPHKKGGVIDVDEDGRATYTTAKGKKYYIGDKGLNRGPNRLRPEEVGGLALSELDGTMTRFQTFADGELVDWLAENWPKAED